MSTQTDNQNPGQAADLDMAAITSQQGRPVPAGKDASADKAAPAKAEAKVSAKERQTDGRKPYQPTEKTRALVEEIFTPEITEVCEKAWGFDLRKLVDSVKRYGILEALAYSRWTPPIKCYPRYASQGGAQYMSVRIWHYKDKDGNLKVGYENPVPVRTMTFRDENNVERLKYDRRTLKVTDGAYSSVMYDGKPLTRSQVEELMLNGVLADPMERTLKDGTTVREVVQSHPYNTERIITVPCSILRQRMMRPESRAFRAQDGETFDLTDTQATELAVGHVVKLGLDHYVRYDIMEGKVREVQDPAVAKKAYCEVIEKRLAAREKIKEEASKTQSQRATAGRA